MDNLELPRAVHLYVEQNIGSDQVDVGYEIVMFKVEDGFSLKWNRSEPEPTEEQLESVYTVWKTEYDAQEYARKRSAEYPSIVDQLDKIYHDGIDEWKKVIKATKDKYPKS